MKLSKRIQRYTLTALLVVVSVTAFAEHEANHRYVVRGYVFDASEVPLENIVISVRMDKRSVGSSHTDANGYYSLQVHLHDADIGSPIEVRAGTSSGQVQMQATRGDQTTARIHFVSFIGDQLIEGDLGKFRFPVWGYVLLFLAALIALVVVVERLRKRRRRLQRKATNATKPKKPKKPKRKRRKRH